MKHTTKPLHHFLSLTLLVSLISLSSSPFIPTDNFLINCGSTTATSHYNRHYIPDHSQKQNSFSFTKDSSFPLKDLNPHQNSPPLYHTARIFTRNSAGSAGYKFNIKKNGTHMVRLHFSPFQNQEFNLRDAKFGVLVSGSLVLKSFSVQDVVVKEFVVRIDGGLFEVEFRPEGGGFGFVNAVEVFSVPVDYVLDEGAKLVTDSGVEEFRGLSGRILETVHRINVGGLRLTPFNDSLWRTWVPDDGFLVLKSAAKSVLTTHSPNYMPGGASREIAPDNVYMTAQEMNKNGTISGSLFNVTWRFPVEAASVQHLVRLHFCDIVSPSLNQLYFDVYINGYSAYKDLDLSVLTVHVLAAPIYIDFVADSDSSRSVSISVGPSALSSTVRSNAILNGVEIMKMIDYEGLNTKTKKNNVWIVVGSVVGGFVVICFVILAVFLACMRRRKNIRSRPAESVGWTPLRTYGGSTRSRTSEATGYTSSGPNGYHGLNIPFADIQFATNNFDKSLIIGSGGFGVVFKGVLKDNTKVAVKRGMPGSRQGLPEFQTEITILSKIRHRHLVSLVGYCEEQSEMILVYEYVEKGPLKSHLYGPQHPPLSWKQRLEVCIGAARGLHYLHTGSAQGIIHRDIKSTNILLDENYVSKVADFGLSRSGPPLDETHVSTGVKGSFGYLDPEYFRRQQLTDKSDVYSFGVVLFEVLCARPAVDPQLVREQVNLAEWAMQWQQKGMLEHIVDPHLAGQIKPNSLKKFGETAEKCLAEYGVDRPTMGDVLWNLEYALQLQVSGPSTARDENRSLLDTSELQPGRSITSHNARTERDDGDGNSEINTNQVFSQLITNEGR